VLLTFLVSGLSLTAQNLNNSTKDDLAIQSRFGGKSQQGKSLQSGSGSLIESPDSPCHARDSNVQIVTKEEVKGKLIHKVAPRYPKTARRNGIQGTVVMCATIGKDGRIKELRAISGPEELVPAALDAVKKWRYQPFELKGETVEVDTDIRVFFQLAQ